MSTERNVNSAASRNTTRTAGDGAGNASMLLGKGDAPDSGRRPAPNPNPPPSAPWLDPLPSGGAARPRGAALEEGSWRGSPSSGR
jgi:hypothetical protein